MRIQPTDLVKPANQQAVDELVGAYPGTNTGTKFFVVLVCHKVTTQTGTQNNGLVIMPLRSDGEPDTKFPYVWPEDLFVHENYVAPPPVEYPAVPQAESSLASSSVA